MDKTLIFSQYKRKIKRNRGGQSGAGYVSGLSSANFGGNGGIGWINPSYASATHKYKIWTASTSIGGILSADIYRKTSGFLPPKDCILIDNHMVPLQHVFDYKLPPQRNPLIYKRPGSQRPSAQIYRVF